MIATAQTLFPVSSLRRIASDPFRPTPVNVCRQNKYTCHPERSSATQKYTATYCTKSRNAVEVLRNGACGMEQNRGATPKGARRRDPRKITVDLPWGIYFSIRTKKVNIRKKKVSNTPSEIPSSFRAACGFASFLGFAPFVPHCAKLRLRKSLCDFAPLRMTR